MREPMDSLVEYVNAPARTAAGASRLVPLDALRGVIIVVMALDHANYFIAHEHPTAEMWTGLFPSYNAALPFLTRLITHIAAPGFFFLMGIGVTLFAASRRRMGWKERSIAGHLLARGLILIALQLLIENRAWPLGQPTSTFPIYFGVLYGLGAALFVGALMLKLRPTVLIGISLTAIAATQVLITLPAAAGTVYPPGLRLLLFAGQTGDVLVYYPLLPWLGVMGLGMAFGDWLLYDRNQAYRRALLAGTACLLLFVIVRALGGFGNTRPPRGTDWIAFLNVVKYPPSIAFLLLTLGVDWLILALLAGAGDAIRRWLQPLVVFGQSPLFFYLTHLYWYALIGLALDPKGIGIPRMLPYWLLGLVVLYPLCWLYGQFKHGRPPNSLWRLL